MNYNFAYTPKRSNSRRRRKRLGAVSPALNTFSNMNFGRGFEELRNRNAEYLRNALDIVKTGGLQSAFDEAEEVQTHAKPFRHLFLSPVF